MNGLVILLITLLVGLPLAWVIAEVKAGPTLRIGFGVIALGVMIVCAVSLTRMVTRFNYNAWFGGATQDLIKTSIAEIEDGRLDRVLAVWRALDSKYKPTYENRAGYFELVTNAVEFMKQKDPLAKGSNWDAPPFQRTTWDGYWENETGFWIVINDIGRSFQVIRSGDNPPRIDAMALSEDNKVLKFNEGENWTHTLTLKNKYEATHEWFDVKQQKVWQTDTLHKLRRATNAEKAVTQQTNVAQAMNPANIIERPTYK
jgi:hypothetical protein